MNLLFASLLSLLFSAPLLAEDVKEGGDVQATKKEVETKQAKAYEKMAEASAPKVRRFHEVLDELLAEFGFDIRQGQMKGLKDLAIRKVSVSDSLPDSYSDYIELLISERIRENSKIRLISCLPCKTKTSRLVEGKLMITSPTTNMADMQRASEQLGIENFMDVVLVYHTTHMVLAFQIFNTATSELVWARTYNSETIKSRFQKLAVDYSQVEKSRGGDEYVPDYRLAFKIGGASIPNVSGEAKDQNMLVFGFQGGEKFNRRRQEFGLLANIYYATSSFTKSYPSEKGTSTESTTTETQPTTSTPKPFKMAIGLNAVFSHHFIGELESYDEIRHGISFGAGGLLATGYLAGMVRSGWDIYFGKRFGIGIYLPYITSSKILVDNEYVTTDGGLGGELVLSINF